MIFFISLASMQPSTPPPPEKGRIQVDCNISAADVYLDGRKVGVTPFEQDIEPGTYHVLVQKFQYTSDEKDVNVEVGKISTFNASIKSTVEPITPVKPTEPVTPPPEGNGLLQINSSPTGAKIYINNEFVFEYTNT